ncbi:hypothetical protein EYF80_063883 [Liparis tanakae]|uniref:Uncharacterized protein n=1 Tax=Liparis tanakae TaxID=230148 RepID=A0A4Z2EBN7_9TELE|nr:hypothetical protein EYF80_063883 [Liparis tanakae]
MQLHPPSSTRPAPPTQLHPPSSTQPAPPSQPASGLLLLKRGGLSLTSLSLTVTVVVPDRPPRWPPMSRACSTTRYWSRVSRSMSGSAVLRTPGEQQQQQQQQQQQTSCIHSYSSRRQRDSELRREGSEGLRGLRV